MTTTPPRQEEALGGDADRVLPHALRTAELRLPRHHIAMLRFRAEQGRTPISSVLARERDGIASIHAEELSAVIPGFAADFTWHDTDPAHLPC